VLYDFVCLREKDEVTYSWFPQDGAAVHTANKSGKLLNEICGVPQHTMKEETT
jgi:hypothetical protein